MTLIPADSFVAPVENSDDVFKFAIPMEAKALDDGSFVVVEDNGDLTIEGYAAIWDGEDREGENFVPGAFQRGTKAFLAAGAPLCFHHKHDHVLGQVTDLHEDDRGLRMRARVDGETAKHPVLSTIYNQIKKGTLKGLSVGGFFRRALIEGKRRIADMDFTEISVTGVPVHTGPSFSVVAGKALASADEETVTTSTETPPAPEAIDEQKELDAIVERLNVLSERFKKAAEQASGNNTDPETDSDD